MRLSSYSPQTTPFPYPPPLLSSIFLSLTLHPILVPSFFPPLYFYASFSLSLLLSLACSTSYLYVQPTLPLSYPYPILHSTAFPLVPLLFAPSFCSFAFSFLSTSTLILPFFIPFLCLPYVLPLTLSTLARILSRSYPASFRNP